jgi:hypothetical protein
LYRYMHSIIANPVALFKIAVSIVLNFPSKSIVLNLVRGSDGPILAGLMSHDVIHILLNFGFACACLPQYFR